MIGTTRQRMAVAAAAALVAGPLAAAAPAFADDGGNGGGHGGGGRVVEARGTGTYRAHWDLQAKHNDGRIELEFEVDTNRAGQVWAVRMTDNGAKVFAGTGRTAAPSGSFTVRATTADRPGADRILARATHGTAVCSAGVVLA